MALEFQVVGIKRAKRPGFLNKNGGTKGEMGLFKSKQLNVFQLSEISNNEIKTFAPNQT